MPDLASKKEALLRIYSWHEAWGCRFSMACRRGCSSCCTRSVTVTGLEAAVLREHLAETGRTGLLAALPSLAADNHRPRTTTNELAAACLQEIESDGEPESWNFDSCPFLADQVCTIYPARPFGCRAFASLVPCADAGTAEVPPLLLTINTVLLQLIEHLDQGGIWGNLLDVLAVDLETKTNGQGPLTCRPCPGFLIPPEEQEEIDALLRALFRELVGRTTLGELLGMGQNRP
ncbi:MAG: YkgJ family cysteine cluster protein [Desulfobacteraceae bacterium]|nr:YkgJ family cysteine cluster protein [Desulfobacteraceae bacterium]